MSDRLAEQIAVSFEELDRLMAAYRPLFERIGETPPEPVELAALAAVLHSFYNGVENLLKRVLVETGEGLPEGELWYRQLLDQVSTPARHRPAVISEDLRETLALYLGFRHVFRHACTFDLQWAKMRELALEVEDALNTLREEIAVFLSEAK